MCVCAYILSLSPYTYIDVCIYIYIYLHYACKYTLTYTHIYIFFSLSLILLASIHISRESVCFIYYHMNGFTEFHLFLDHLGFPGGARGKESTSKSGDIEDMGLIPRSGSSPRGGHGEPLQYSYLENPKDRRAWQAIVHRVAKSQT